MNTHVTENDIGAVVAGIEVAPEVAEHLSSCVSCRQQVALMQRSIAERREEMAAECPDWQHQLREVMTRLSDTPVARTSGTRRWRVPVLAAAAALVAAVGIRLFLPPEVGDATPGNDLAVEEILAEVDAVLADDSLPGFESIDPGVNDLATLLGKGAS